ncbi:hypothetical protein HDU99_009191, partial [Rhizoclosmatium hyalinum]
MNQGAVDNRCTVNLPGGSGYLNGIWLIGGDLSNVADTDTTGNTCRNSYKYYFDYNLINYYYKNFNNFDNHVIFYYKYLNHFNFKHIFNVHLINIININIIYLINIININIIYLININIYVFIIDVIVNIYFHNINHLNYNHFYYHNVFNFKYNKLHIYQFNVDYVYFYNLNINENLIYNIDDHNHNSESHPDSGQSLGGTSIQDASSCYDSCSAYSGAQVCVATVWLTNGLSSKCCLKFGMAKGTVNATTTLYLPRGTGTETGVWLLGFDLGSPITDTDVTGSTCRNSCGSTSACVLGIFKLGKCYLKSDIGTPQIDPDTLIVIPAPKISPPPNWVALSGLDSGGSNIGCFGVGETFGGFTIQTAADCAASCSAYKGSQVCVASVWVSNPAGVRCCAKYGMGTPTLNTTTTIYLPSGTGTDAGVWLNDFDLGSPVSDTDITGSACRNLCGSNSACVLGILKLGKCYLKSGIGSAVIDPNSVIVIPPPKTPPPPNWIGLSGLDSGGSDIGCFGSGDTFAGIIIKTAADCSAACSAYKGTQVCVASVWVSNTAGVRCCAKYGMGTPTINSTATVYLPSGTGTDAGIWLNGFDLGNPIPDTDVTGSTCRNSCGSTNTCVVSIFKQGKCYLKSGIGSAQIDPTSLIIVPVAKPQPPPNWIALSGLDTGGSDIGCFSMGDTFAGILIQTAADCAASCNAYKGSQVCVASVWVANPAGVRCCAKYGMGTPTINSTTTVYLPSGTVSIFKQGKCYLKSGIGSAQIDPTSLIVVPPAKTPPPPNWVELSGLDAGGSDIGCYGVGETFAGIVIQTPADCKASCGAYKGSKICVASVWVANPAGVRCCAKYGMGTPTINSTTTVYLPSGT